MVSGGNAQVFSTRRYHCSTCGILVLLNCCVNVRYEYLKAIIFYNDDI